MASRSVEAFTVSRHLRIDDDGPKPRYQYRAPDLDFEALIVYDASGLVVEYPGIASRAL